MKSSHKENYFISETYWFTSFDMSGALYKLVKPLAGQESEKGGVEVFNVIKIFNRCIKYLLSSFCSVKQ